MTVKTFDEKKLKKLIEESDPYVQDYIKKLKESSKRWEMLFYEVMQRRRKKADYEGLKGEGLVPTKKGLKTTDDFDA